MNEREEPAPSTELVLHSQVIGQCPTHGPQRDSVSVTLDIPEAGHYCLQCYAEWLAATLPKLAPTNREVPL